MTQSLSRISFYLDRCIKEADGDHILLLAPSELAAFGLKNCAFEVALWLKEQSKEKAIIRWIGDDGEGYEIYDWFAEATSVSSSASSQASKSQLKLPNNLIYSMPELIIPDWDMDLNELYRYEKKTAYIFHHLTNEMMFINKAGVEAQQRAAHKMLGKDASALDDPEQIIAIGERLEREGTIESYEFPGWRYCPIRGRKRMMFVEFWKLVEYLGEPCRLGIVHSAEEIAYSS